MEFPRSSSVGDVDGSIRYLPIQWANLEGWQQGQGSAVCGSAICSTLDG
jgi:hypothetical protein